MARPTASDGGVSETSGPSPTAFRDGTSSELLAAVDDQLRALAEVYACADAKESFVKAFAAAWIKVMNLDRAAASRASAAAAV